MAAVGRGRLPEFFVVGHPKCGTTALYRALSNHPQIYMASGMKSTGFFVPEEQPPAKPGSPRPRTLEQYMDLFAGAGPDQITGEATTGYLRSETAAARIAEMQPEARIIAVLREPAAFLRSFHMQLMKDHVEREQDLRKALALESERREGRHMPDSPRAHVLLYSESIRYVDQLRRYQAVFPDEQILVLIYDDFRSDNDNTIRRVLRFLDVDDSAPIEAVEANPSVRVRSVKAYKMLRSAYVGSGPVSRAVKKAVKPVTTRRMRRQAFVMARSKLYGAPRPPDEELSKEIRRRYKPEVVALSEYLDRDLVSLWGYDELD